MNKEVEQALQKYLDQHQPATIHGTAKRIAMLIWMEEHLRCVINLLESLVKAGLCRATGSIESKDRTYLLDHTAFAK